MFVRPGYGLACDPGDADDIAQAVRWFLDHPAERSAMGAAGRARVRGDWNYESQFAPVLAVLERDAAP
jgi:glycosyltransferase involved in cell wall biosynthesis